MSGILTVFHSHLWHGKWKRFVFLLFQQHASRNKPNRHFKKQLPASSLQNTYLYFFPRNLNYINYKSHYNYLKILRSNGKVFWTVTYFFIRIVIELDSSGYTKIHCWPSFSVFTNVPKTSFLVWKFFIFTQHSQQWSYKMQDSKGLCPKSLQKSYTDTLI